jgi:hypothetical protein
VRIVVAAFRMALLELAARRRRILALLVTAALFLAAGATAAALGRQDGHVEFDRLFQIGGYPLISGMLLAGWLIGRFPLVATLVLMAGVVAADREDSRGRLLAVRPAPAAVMYGARFLVLAAAAFLLSAVLLPAFDLIMLGEWAGPATLVLILAHVLVWGGLTALLSVPTGLDAWVALMLALLALVWTSLATAGMLPLAPPIADAVAFVLPPQASLFALEGAFADLQPIPWNAFAFAAGYGLVALLLAALLLARREL